MSVVNESASATTLSYRETWRLEKAPRLIPAASAAQAEILSAGAILENEGSSTRIASSPRVTTPLLLTPQRRSKRQFKSLARWEGAVLEVYGTYFSAEVIDLDNGEVASAEFELAEVAEDDIALCVPGGLFYWSVGYEIRDSGQISRASFIRFRRLGGGVVQE